MPITPSITIRLPERVRRTLEEQADRERLKLGQYARRILWDHAEAEQAKRPQVEKREIMEAAR